MGVNKAVAVEGEFAEEPPMGSPATADGPSGPSIEVIATEWEMSYGETGKQVHAFGSKPCGGIQ